MKTKKIKQLLYLLLIPMIFSSLYGQDAPVIKWQGGATDRIYASPAVIGDKVFIGCVDGRLYCKDLNSGRGYYQYQTGNLINSIPLVYNDYLILVSGNDLICFDPETISEKWRFITEAQPELVKMDEWDYHHSSPILYDGIVYFGCGNGVLYGINPENGEQVFSCQIDENSPIRTTPNIVDGILYFGDWEGVVYAVNIATSETKWSTRTWTGQHYDNFAGILSQIEVGEDLVYYGARNHIIKALNKNTGNVAWSYESLDGGWISGDPVLYGDLLLIGGSDNHKFLCFNANTGQLLWEYEFPGNCFSKPIIANNKVTFTTGNAYANTGSNDGRGFIHTLNLPGGELFYEQEFPGNVFSSPILHNGIVYIGCDDKNMYALDGFILMGIATNSTGSIYLPSSSGVVKGFKNYPNPFLNNTRFSLILAEPGDVKIHITDLLGRNISSLDLPGLPAGINEFEWNGLSGQDSQNTSRILLARIFHNGSASGTIQLLMQ